MENEIFGFVRDAVVIGYLFVLRIGVPLILTLFIGWFIERKLVERDAREAAWLKQMSSATRAVGQETKSETPQHT